MPEQELELDRSGVARKVKEKLELLDRAGEPCKLGKWLSRQSFKLSVVFRSRGAVQGHHRDSTGNSRCADAGLQDPVDRSKQAGALF